MTYRLDKIYTRKGDAGFTHLAGSSISKDDLLVEALGTIDELNAAVGLTAVYAADLKAVHDCLKQVQNDLFDMGGELHAPGHMVVTEEKVTWLEQQLDAFNKDLPPLKEFILPGGNTGSATCHLARTICRRAERCMVRLHRQVPVQNVEMLRYLNRLSDLLFVISRVLARKTEEKERMWER